MFQNKFVSHAVHWYMSDITSRVIAETGTPTDRFHLGKIILRCFKDDPSFVLQIDGATGESETFTSATERTVRCATSFRNFGLQQGDVVVIMAPNHLDVAIPFYAALYVGLPIAAVDRTLTPDELQSSFSCSSPKIIFCQSEKAPDVKFSLNQLNNDALIVTFDKGDIFLSFAEFMGKFGADTPVAEFQPADFDPEETTAFLITTSGSTGTSKFAAITHKNFAMATPYYWESHYDFPSPTRMSLLLSPLQWLTAFIMFVQSPIIRFTCLQTSQPVTQEHIYYLINTYRPTFSIISPTMLTTLIRPEVQNICDFTCFTKLYVGGSAVHQDLIDKFQNLSPNTLVTSVYGMTEIAGFAFNGDFQVPRSSGKIKGCFQYRIVNRETRVDVLEPNVAGELWLKGPSIFKNLSPNTLVTSVYGMTEIAGFAFNGDFQVPRSSGKIKGCFQYRIVNRETRVDVLEPNVAGELWLKGPSIFKGYYNNSEHTNETFAENGWFKTGDLFYRDDCWNFYFVDRLKSLLKYKSHQISPVELEGVIRRHPGVMDVGVTAVPDLECGDLVVACVVRVPGSVVTAQEIKNWVAESLTESKHLKGGVIFIDAIPVLTTTKVNRRKLKEMVMTMDRE